LAHGEGMTQIILEGLQNYEDEQFIYGQANHNKLHCCHLKMDHVATINYDSGNTLELEWFIQF